MDSVETPNTDALQVKNKTKEINKTHTLEIRDSNSNAFKSIKGSYILI